MVRLKGRNLDTSEGYDFEVQPHDLVGSFLIPFTNEAFPVPCLAKGFVGGSGDGQRRAEREVAAYLALGSRRRDGLCRAYGAGKHHVILPHYTRSMQLDDNYLFRLDDWDKLSLGASLFRAIASLGESGIVHQDLAPKNILVDSSSDQTDKSIRIVDFSHALVVGSNSDSTGRSGSPEWTHPSRPGGQAACYWSDLWEGLLSWLLVWTEGQNQRAALGRRSLPDNLPGDVWGVLKAEVLTDSWSASAEEVRRSSLIVASVLSRAAVREERLAAELIKVRQRGRRAGSEIFDDSLPILVSRAESAYVKGMAMWTDRLADSQIGEVSWMSGSPITGTTFEISSVYQLTKETLMKADVSSFGTRARFTLYHPRSKVAAALVVIVTIAIVLIVYFSTAGFIV